MTHDDIVWGSPTTNRKCGLSEEAGYVKNHVKTKVLV